MKKDAPPPPAKQIVARAASGTAKAKSGTLTPLQMAAYCKRQKAKRWAPATIADKLGVTVEYVNQLLTLADAPPSVWNMVQAGEATAATALEAMRIHGDEAGEVMKAALKAAKASGKSKLTSKFMPTQIRRKAFQTAAPAMYEVVKRVKAHSTFHALPKDVKSMINQILVQIPPQSEPKE